MGKAAQAPVVALKALARTLRQLSDVNSTVVAPFASFVTDDLKRTAAAETDPYGRGWQALRPATIRKEGHARILYASGALQGSLEARPLPAIGLTLTVGPSYAAFHLIGGARYPARPFFPVNGMPSKWRDELKRLVHADIIERIG